MCRKYHAIRTSKQYVFLWKQLLGKVVSGPPEPAFYQEVTDLMFESIVHTVFQYDRIDSELQSIT